jgi:hypothetical protein
MGGGEERMRKVRDEERVGGGFLLPLGAVYKEKDVEENGPRRLACNTYLGWTRGREREERMDG